MDMQSSNLSNPDLSFPANPPFHTPSQSGVPPGSQRYVHSRPLHLETSFSASSGRTTPSADEYSPSGLLSDRFLGRDPFSSNKWCSRFHSPNSLALPHSSHTRDQRPSSLGPNGFHTQSTLMPTEHLYSATEVPPKFPPESCQLFEEARSQVWSLEHSIWSLELSKWSFELSKQVSKVRFILSWFIARIVADQLYSTFFEMLVQNLRTRDGYEIPSLFTLLVPPNPYSCHERSFSI